MEEYGCPWCEAKVSIPYIDSHGYPDILEAMTRHILTKHTGIIEKVASNEVP